jgi:hypothetical protein
MASEDQQKSHLEKVTSHLTTPEWREVILIINSLLPDATIFLTLLKEKVDNLIVSSPQGRDFVAFLKRKAVSVATDAKISAVKAFYLSLFQDRNLNLAFAIDVNLANELPPELSLDLSLARMVSTAEQILTKFSWKTMLDLTQAFDLKRKYTLDKDFQSCLNHLQERLPSFNKELGEEWCQATGNLWLQELKQCISKYRYFDQDWQFTEAEKELLWQYYQANLFLMECLRNPCVIDEDQRDNIVNSLLS